MIDNIMEFLKIILLPILGAFISLITVYLNNKSQHKRDIEKYENDRKLERDKRNFEDEKEREKKLIYNIEQFHTLLCYFKYSISLTQSIIDSSCNLKPEEFDKNYKIELEKLLKIKNLTFLHFSMFYEEVQKIENIHNTYWGNQNQLLHLDVNKDKEDFQLVLSEIIKISDKASYEINILIRKLDKYKREHIIDLEVNFEN